MFRMKIQVITIEKMENGIEIIKDFVQAITTTVTTTELIAQLMSVLLCPDIVVK